RLGNLLEILVAAHGAGTRLGPDDVAPFLGEAGGVAPWELTDAIDRGDTGAALEHLHRQLGGGGRHPLVVMASLHSHAAHMRRRGHALLRVRGMFEGTCAGGVPTTMAISFRLVRTIVAASPVNG